MKKNTTYSLLDIMREQEAESSRSKTHVGLTKDEDSSEQHPVENVADISQAEIFGDDQLARQLATELDEGLALDYQNDERAELIHSHPRNFNAIESSYVNLKQSQEEDEYESDEYADYSYGERNIKNVAPLKKVHAGDNQMEFKTYSTRNTGVKEFKKQKKFIAKQYQSAVNVFQIKQEDSDYGRIIGSNLNSVYCFWDGLIRKAHVLKKVKMLRGLSAGALVLVKIRKYQESVVDIIHVYYPHEEAILFEMGEIVTRDPLEHLPVEVLQIVFEHMESQYSMDMLRQVSRTWNVIAKEYSPAKYLPRKIQYERRIKEIEWEELSKFHWKLYNHEISMNIVSSEQCKFFWASSIYHFKANCDLKKRVLLIAEKVWNEFASESQRTVPKDINGTEDGLFTFSKCYYLKHKDAQLRNFASLVLWSWIKLHEREDISTIDIPNYFRMFLMQSARHCVDKLITNLKAKLTTAPAFQRQAIRARIEFLEERWKPLLEQPAISMEQIDFTLESKPESSDSLDEAEYLSGSDSEYISDN